VRSGKPVERRKQALRRGRQMRVEQWKNKYGANVVKKVRG
jgi:hypothetical protein